MTDFLTILDEVTRIIRTDAPMTREQRARLGDHLGRVRDYFAANRRDMRQKAFTRDVGDAMADDRKRQGR